MQPMESAEVLVVDDSLDDAELTVHALKIGEFMPKVLWIAGANEALLYMFRARHYANREPAPPRLILLDVDMAGIGGIGVLARLKQAPRTKCVPIVMLSSRQDDAALRKCYELGANSCLVKPAAAVEYFQKIAVVASYWLTVNRHLHEPILTSVSGDDQSSRVGSKEHATLWHA